MEVTLEVAGEGEARLARWRGSFDQDGVVAQSVRDGLPVSVGVRAAPA